MGTLPTGPGRCACPGVRAGSGQDRGVGSSAFLGAAPSRWPWLQLGALNLSGAGSWKSCPSKEGNSQPSFGEIPHQPRGSSFSLFSLFFFPFGLNSWLISQLWQRGILSQVSAFPSQARGHGIRAELLPDSGRDGERGEETRRGFGFLTPVAAEGAGLQPGGPFSSTTSPDPHPREGSDPLPTGSRAGAAVKGPMPVGMGHKAAGPSCAVPGRGLATELPAASGSVPTGAGPAAGLARGTPRQEGAAEPLHLRPPGTASTAVVGEAQGRRVGVPAPLPLPPSPTGPSGSALVTVASGDSRCPGALR